MLWRDYREQVLADAKEAIDDNSYYWEDWESTFDELFVDDSVTGNGSGSYTFSTAKAAENVGGWIFDYEAQDAFKEYGYEQIPIDMGPEALDVIARCYWLDMVADELAEYYKEAIEQ